MTGRSGGDHTAQLFRPLDPAANRLPAAVRRVHLMGICGTGMGALAGMLQEAGYEVDGADENVYPPMSDFLARRGIPVAPGYRPAHLEPPPDLVVVGNVIRRDNPQVQALAAAGLAFLSFPQTLAEVFLRDRLSLVVCGTHGKTTTAALLASSLVRAGLDPSFLVGGVLQEFNSSFRLGGGECFVVEGDEYDTAFFDKGPKFAHYRPRLAILTSVEFDHADIFADFAAVRRVFARLVAMLPPDGLLVACLDDPVVRDLAASAPCQVAGYGAGGQGEWRLAACDPAAGRLTVDRAGVRYGTFSIPLPGRHNAVNALAVIAALDWLGIDRQRIAAGLATFAGVRRRQEVRGEVAGVTVIDDFAHHPTAVRETLAALKARYAGRRLVAVFEPRTNSSRRRIFQQAYAAAFDAADLVLVREPTPHRAILPQEMFSAARLATDLRKRGVSAEHFPHAGAIVDFLAVAARPGDVVAVLSNGGFEDIHQRLLAALAGKEQR